MSNKKTIIYLSIVIAISITAAMLIGCITGNETPEEKARLITMYNKDAVDILDTLGDSLENKDILEWKEENPTKFTATKLAFNLVINKLEFYGAEQSLIEGLTRTWNKLTEPQPELEELEEIPVE